MICCRVISERALHHSAIPNVSSRAMLSTPKSKQSILYNAIKHIHSPKTAKPSHHNPLRTTPYPKSSLSNSSTPLFQT